MRPSSYLFHFERWTTMRFPSTRVTTIDAPCSMNSPSDTTSTRSPSISAIPAVRSGDTARPLFPNHLSSVSSADAYPSSARSPVSKINRRPHGKRGRNRRTTRLPINAASNERTTRPTAFKMKVHDAPAPKTQTQSTYESCNSQDSSNAEARNNKNFESQQHKAGCHQEHLFPAGQLNQPVTPEKKRQAQDS